MHDNGTIKSFIVQEYLANTFLYKGRKFDIRHYLMITNTEGTIRGYFYREGYIRTSSFKYSPDNVKSLVHLTNDSIQKQSREYGKHEKGNKLSYAEFEKYLRDHYPQYSFFRDIAPRIK